MRKLIMLFVVMNLGINVFAQYADKTKDEKISGSWTFNNKLSFTNDTNGYRFIGDPFDLWVQCYSNDIYVRDIHRSFKYGGTVGNGTTTPANSFIFSHEWGNSSDFDLGAQTVKMRGDASTKKWQWALRTDSYSGREILSINNEGSGRVGINQANPKEALDVNGNILIQNGWLRVKGQKGLYFQDYGGGFCMKDNSWIRTWGNKNFYHNTGIMRTDGTFQVGSGGNRFLVNTSGKVGIGTSNPNSNYRLDINGTVISSDIKIRKTGNISKILFSGQTNDPGEIRHIENNNSAELWIDPSDDFDAGATNDYFIVGEPDTKTKRFWVRGDGAAYVNKNLGIGKTAESNYKLDVAGTIRAEEILVEANGNTADFVFADTYHLKDLTEVENFIKTNKHLPNIPSAEDMEKQGVNLAEMNKLLLQKVEELTLYAIQQKEEVKKQKVEREKETEALLKRLEELEKLVIKK